LGQSVSQGRQRRKGPQRAVSQNIRRSGKPLFFGWGGHLTHHEREQMKERIAAGIGILLALLVIAIIGGGALYNYVIRPDQQAAAKAAAKAEKIKLGKEPYAVVGGVTISRGWYNAVLTAEEDPVKTEITQATAAGSKYASLVAQLQQEIQADPQNIYNYMIANVVIEQKGAKIGAKTKPADEAKYLKSLIKKQFHGSEANFATAGHQVGLTVEQYKQYNLMNKYNFAQVTKVLNKSVPKTALFVKVRHILLGATKPTRASFSSTKLYKAALKTYATQLKTAHQTATKVLGLLAAGGNSNPTWKTLAAKYSTDTGSKTKGGLYTWAQDSTYVPSFSKAAATWPLNQTRIVQSRFGFHVLEVLGRRNQKLTSTELQTNEQAALNKWITKAEASPKGYVTRKYTPPAPTTTGAG
jgi:hypothetical protein